MAKQLSQSTPTQRESVALDPAVAVHGFVYPTIDPSPPYMLAFNQSSWTIIEGKVLPQLIQIPIVSGVNGMEVDAQGLPVLGAVRTRLEKQGTILIPFSKGPGGASYMHKVQTRNPVTGRVADAYIPCWADVHASDHRLYPRMSEYAAWLQGLIDEGFLPSAPTHVIQALHDKTVGDLARARYSAEKDPTAGALELRTRLETQLAQLKTLLEQGPTAPKVESQAASFGEGAEPEPRSKGKS